MLRSHHYDVLHYSSGCGFTGVGLLSEFIFWQRPSRVISIYYRGYTGFTDGFMRIYPDLRIYKVSLFLALLEIGFISGDLVLFFRGSELFFGFI